LLHDGFPLPRSTHLDRVPVLAGEGILGLLLEALLSFRKALVPIVLLDHVLSRIATLPSKPIPPGFQLHCVEGGAGRGERRETHFPTAMIAKRLPCRGAVEVERCCRDAVGERGEKDLIES